MGDVVPLRNPEPQGVLPGVEPPPPPATRAYGMTVADWHARGLELRSHGLTELGDFYCENALRLSRGERVLWPPPPTSKASKLLADKPGPEPFHDDGREP